MILQHLMIMAATSTPKAPDLITTLIGAGPFGVLAGLFIWGFVVPKKPYDDLAADRDYWREAWKQEKDSHQVTREALTQSEKRGDAAVETANMTNKLLAGIQQVANKSER
jgi:hypothetical protein